MNEKTQKVLQWLDETCTQAFTEGQAGDTSLLNRLGREPSFAYYINNVHGRKVLTPEQFAGQMPKLMEEVTRVMEQYELVSKQPERDARLTAVEEQLTKLMGMVGELLESKNAEAVETKSTKKDKKAKVEAATETEEADVSNTGAASTEEE